MMENNHIVYNKADVAEIVRLLNSVTVTGINNASIIASIGKLIEKGKMCEVDKENE